VELILLDADPGGGHGFLKEALSALKEQGVRRLLVEGGSGVFTRLIEAELADQVMVFIAPKIVGGIDALPPVAGRGRAPMAEAYPLSDLRIRRTGKDAFMEGFFRWPGSSPS
jgi:diaminohydroxyphosphoribosylaminopyrimidine deaminase/5-amino-6-(5-phosphoribosylamino)uracil reductase